MWTSEISIRWSEMSAKSRLEGQRTAIARPASMRCHCSHRRVTVVGTALGIFWKPDLLSRSGRSYICSRRHLHLGRYWTRLPVSSGAELHAYMESADRDNPTSVFVPAGLACILPHCKRRCSASPAACAP